MDEQEAIYRLRAFQLARLRRALAQRNRATGSRSVHLANACVLSLYKSCVDAGDVGQARDLIELFHREVTPGA